MDDATATAPGPDREIDLGSGALPLWVVPFDAAGACTAPVRRARIIGEIAAGGYTDVFLFSHGWNNTFGQAMEKYELFISGYHDLVESYALRQPAPYKPLVVGVYWPSIDLILPWETAPKIAGAAQGGGSEPAAMDLNSMVRDAQQSLDPERAGELRSLTTLAQLTDAQARKLAELLAQAYPDDDELDAAGGTRTPEDVMKTWFDLADAGFAEDEAGPESFGVAREDRVAVDLQSAGNLAAALGSARRLDPRDILRAFTVYKMKDRAGRVGAVGGGPLLRDILSADARPRPRPRLHLIGHSYGCRLLLSAICAAPLPRTVRSLLLLEPAVNYLCFAQQVPKVGGPGGFQSALTRVEQPILSTFSSHDRALHDFFHIAVRRRSDLGELRVAGLGQAPSIYAALGGWGPGGLTPAEATEVPLARFPNRYALNGVSYRVYALNGETGITSHSDVVNDWTFWALYNQVTA
jgi:hypothetical protein